MSIQRKESTRLRGEQWRRFVASIWLFPALLTLMLVLLTAFGISGSSIGVYHNIFYGGSKDSSLLFNHPEPIRSDEWLVNSQMTIAQANNGYARINDKIGGGEDLSLLVDAPYKDWSMVFKPHNLAFFVMPFENAFAFRWWFMGYLLILSVYFFVLELLPNKRLLGALLGLGLFFTPFIQWWYLYGTMGSIFYCLFGGLLLMKVVRARTLLHRALWGALLAYVIACLALILYPPFQIATGLAMAAFGAGFLLEQRRQLPGKQLLQRLGVLAGAVAIGGAITVAFVLTRYNVIQTVAHTAYPGNRLEVSGGADFIQLYAGHLQRPLQVVERSNHYRVAGLPSNQSEASNFVLLLPFLFIPSLYLIWRQWKRDRVLDWSLLMVNALFTVLMLWMFVPHLNFIGKFTQLERVPHVRLLIGLGLLGLLQLILFIRRYSDKGEQPIKRRWVIPYAIVVMLIELVIGYYVMKYSPGYIGAKSVLIYALPVPIVLYLLLRKKFVWSALVLLLFMIAMSHKINPIYHGTDVVQKTPLSAAISELSAHNSKLWVADNLVIENFAVMNGAHSLSGVYTYPQLTLWKDADPTAKPDVYNRYSHTVFSLDRDPGVVSPTTLSLRSPDSMLVSTEPCSALMRERKVGFIITTAQFLPGDSCLRLAREVTYPELTIYIYKTTW